MPTAAEIDELREAWIRAPRGRRAMRERALREAVTAALRDELTGAGASDPAPIPPAPVDLPPLEILGDEATKPFWQRGQYA